MLERVQVDPIIARETQRLSFVLRHRLWRLKSKASNAWDRTTTRFPRLTNEGEATARAIDFSFNGYPLEENYRDKEEAVMHLQMIWDIIDDWGDGRRINVERAQNGLGDIVREYRDDYEKERAARLASEAVAANPESA